MTFINLDYLNFTPLRFKFQILKQLDKDFIYYIFKYFVEYTVL